MNLAERLRHSRLRAGYPRVAQFAEAISVAPQSVYRYQRGEQAPGLAVIVRWARVTGVELDWLATGRGEGPGELDATGTDG